ncbi:hypothetical protein [Endosaccharibacter trunci]
MFDRWLKMTLRKRYDEALDEPVPHDLLAILGEPPYSHNEH